MIAAHGLSKHYGDKLAVDDLSFTVRPGVVTGFLGPNGAGKSTTMRLILGLDAPSAGWVTVNGKRYSEHPAPLAEPCRRLVTPVAGWLAWPKTFCVHFTRILTVGRCGSHRLRGKGATRTQPETSSRPAPPDGGRKAHRVSFVVRPLPLGLSLAHHCLSKSIHQGQETKLDFGPITAAGKARGTDPGRIHSHLPRVVRLCGDALGSGVTIIPPCRFLPFLPVGEREISGNPGATPCGGHRET